MTFNSEFKLDLAFVFFFLVFASINSLKELNYSLLLLYKHYMYIFITYVLFNAYFTHMKLKK